MVKNVSFIGQIGLVSEGNFHSTDALLVLFVGKVCLALFIKDLWVCGIYRESTLQILNTVFDLAHIKVALCSIPKELHVIRLTFYCFSKRSNGLGVVFESVIATSEAIVYSTHAHSSLFVFICSFTLAELFNGLNYVASFELRCSHVKDCH